MRLALEEWGDPGDPRVVCLHGVTSHGRHFAKLAEAGLAGFHVLAPDLLGHGSSPYEPPWSLDAHVDAIVETVGVESAVLIGHSFGGRLAFEIAARAPKLVPRLVLLDPAIFLPPEIALAAAENARQNRAYVSFDEGIDRRYDESQLRSAPRELLEEELAGHLVWSDDGFRYRYCHSAVIAAYGEMASLPPPSRACEYRRSSSSAPPRTSRTTTSSTPTGRRSETFSKWSRSTVGTPSSGTRSRRRQPSSARFSSHDVSARARGDQTTYSSAIARTSSRTAIPSSTSSRVTVKGGTTMTTFQCVMR